MKSIAVIILTLFTTLFAAAADTTNVTATINGKVIEFGADVRPQVVQRLVDLLASCAYMNPKPRWNATSTEPKSIADAEKQSHLHLQFDSPRRIEVPIEKVTLQAREMVVTLPLATAGIWVRTHKGISYFAMFDHAAAERLQKLLDDAQRP